MKSTPAIVLAALFLSACGAGNPSAEPIERVDSTVTPTSPPSTTTTVPPVSVPEGTTPADAAVPETTEFVEVRGGLATGLSIDASLLPEGAVAAPWEFQWRQLDAFAYGSGPNQTDCDAYWVLEQLRGSGGGHAMWWADGGNLNHYVSRVEEPFFAQLLEVLSLAEACPVVTWQEGGAFSVDGFELDDGIGFRFTEIGTDQVTWFGVTAFGDLVSVLDVPLWTGTNGERIEFGETDLNRLVTEMTELLMAAPEEPLPPPPTLVPPTTTTPTTTSTSTAPTTTTTLPLDDLAALLLDEDDLPAGYSSNRVRAHSPDDPDDELVEECPAAESIERIDVALRWTRSTDGSDGVEFDQIIGEATSADDAADMVRQFAGLATCDLTMSFGADATTSVDSIEVNGADEAVTLSIIADDGTFRGELFVVAVGEVVLVLSIDVEGSAEADLRAIVEAAVTKVRDA